MTAMYLREGIESIGLKPNEEEAARLMFQAASYLRDRIAQYELAMMYLSGQGVERNTKMALMHLRNSVRKRYAPAQAVLGDMLWRGKDVKRSPGEGLAFMVIAVDNATDEERGFVEPFLANALAEADNVSVQQANIALKAFNSTYRDKSGEPPLQIELNSQMALGSASAGAEAGPSAKPNMPTDGFGLGSQPAR
jgi:TPR repeat protein